MASNSPLARADSITSISSDDAASSLSIPVGGPDASPISGSASAVGSAGGATGGDGEKRTRKRFTELQQTMLENMFHRTSHPTREEREALANNFGMQAKSVTIWFQNRRQNERKATRHTPTKSSPLSTHTIASTPNASYFSPSYNAPTPYTPYAAPADTPHASTTNPVRRTYSMPHRTAHDRERERETTFFSSPTPQPTRSSTPKAKHLHHTHIHSHSLQSRPSLDQVATLNELRTAPPHTPKRPPRAHTYGASGALYDNMPSSPLAPPSPPPREYVEFGKKRTTTKTLEWACAAARLVNKEGGSMRVGGRPDLEDVYEENESSGPSPLVRRHSEPFMGGSSRKSGGSAGSSRHGQQSRSRKGERELERSTSRRKEGSTKSHKKEKRELVEEGGGEETEEDEPELITPFGSQEYAGYGARSKGKGKAVEDDSMDVDVVSEGGNNAEFDAALILAQMGRAMR